jgi:hypothetical protein
VTEAERRGRRQCCLGAGALQVHVPRRAALTGIAVEQHLDGVGAQLAALVRAGRELEAEAAHAQPEGSGALGIERLAALRLDA